MTKEDKQLLLVDLCERVPYHPKGRVANARTGAVYDEWLTCATFPMFVNITNNCRLYLRPMSSMTEEENKKLDEIWLKHTIEEGADYLNSIHVDYRGLIKKGLALEAPEGMYKMKEQQ